MQKNIFLRIWTFYLEDFKPITLGEILWTLTPNESIYHVLYSLHVFLLCFFNQEEYVTDKLMEKIAN